VPYETIRAEDLVVTDLDGRIVEGSLRPSSDLDTHLVLYKAFPAIGGVAHTHSEYATAWGQAQRPIPCFGTTHADYFHGPVPVTDPLTAEEIASDYEKHTGDVIVRAFAGRDPMTIPAVLVANHGPFAWGVGAAAAAHCAEMLEAAARIAWLTISINKDADPIGSHLHNKHFLRKHGPGATYGQATTFDPKKKGA
jgi:L-ribulose-5-phosphate 4-epimerase